MDKGYIQGNAGKVFFRKGDIHRVPKVWGEEQWIVNKEYCGKKLILRKNHRCSMHEHAEKDEVFYLQSGKVLMELGKKKFTLMPGDFVHVRAKTPHRFTGLQDSEIIEFSTNHKEDDSYRTEFSGHVEQERHDREVALINRFPHSSVLVLGDVMLDTYTSGDVTRISPEAPIPIVRFRNRRHVPGGAANAAANITALGGRATLLGVCGKDSAGRMLTQLLKKRAVRSTLVTDVARCTTEKQRIVAADAHQIVRIDEEITDDLTPAIQSKLLALLKRDIKKHSVLLLSDYAKGVFSPSFLKSCITIAKKARVPVILDPKPYGSDYLSDARGVTLITPNRNEARLLGGRGYATSKALATAVAKKLKSGVLCTLGGEGMILSDPKGKTLAFPALSSGVVDVSGAGDTVAATVALALAAGGSMVEAVDLSNRAAGIVVGKAGTATATAHELLRAL